MVTRQYWLFGLVLAAGVLLTATPVFGGTIGTTVTVNSDLTGTEYNSIGADVAIPDLDPFWQPNNPGGSSAVWISYADTGTAVCLPGNANSAPCPPNVTGTITLPNPAPPTATFFKTFTLPNADNIGTLSVWADDTARVYLCAGSGPCDTNSSSLLIDANSNLGSHCASSPVGCGNDPAVFNFPGTDSYTGGGLNLGAGTYTLEVQAYQLGGGPFGVMYSGSFDSLPTSVPEPASYALLGLGLAGMGLLARRKRA